MKAVIQRVRSATVYEQDENGKKKVLGSIQQGICTLLGIECGDTNKDADWMIRKILSLRIFEDKAGKMNESLKDIQGQHLIISQFTLLADTDSGNRPGFTRAARPPEAIPLYEYALKLSQDSGIGTQSGRFGADMQVELVNDGPVTLILAHPKISLEVDV